MNGKREIEKRIEAEQAVFDKACKGCVYRTADRCCDYIGIVGKRRPCPPGPGCTVKKTGERRRVDYEKVKTLYKEGKTDKEIAELAGCSLSTVSNWRRLQGRKPNQQKSKEEKPGEKRGQEGMKKEKEEAAE